MTYSGSSALWSPPKLFQSGRMTISAQRGSPSKPITLRGVALKDLAGSTVSGRLGQISLLDARLRSGVHGVECIAGRCFDLSDSVRPLQRVRPVAQSSDQLSFPPLGRPKAIGDSADQIMDGSCFKLCYGTCRLFRLWTVARTACASRVGHAASTCGPPRSVEDSCGGMRGNCVWDDDTLLLSTYSTPLLISHLTHHGQATLRDSQRLHPRP